MKANKFNPLYSIIVITKNEERNIERCLKSISDVFTELNYTYEIIMVDSNSSDFTIKRATDLKISNLKIIRIIKSNNYNAALGRNIGSNIALGDYLLFLDGDMKLYKDFLIRFKDFNDKSCAGFIGIRDDIIVNPDFKPIKVIKNKYNIKKLRVAPHFGGALLIKKEIFDEVGGFKNNIDSFEEPELYIRLKSKGYKVYEIPEKMIDHFDKQKRLGNKLKLLFSKRGKGLGQAIRSTLKDRNSLKYFFIHKPFAQVVIPITVDLLSFKLLLLSILNINFFWGFIFFQLLCLLICIIFFDSKKFFTSKLLLIPTLLGLIEDKKVKYAVQTVTTDKNI